MTTVVLLKIVLVSFGGFEPAERFPRSPLTTSLQAEPDEVALHGPDRWHLPDLVSSSEVGGRISP